MDNWFRSKWFIRIISLAFAILLYITVSVDGNTSQSDPRYTPSKADEIETVEDVPVDIRIDKNKYVVNGVPETIKVRLEGAASILRPTARQKSFNVYVDLEKLGEGEHNVEIQLGQLPKGLTAFIEPKEIKVTIEERASKDFNVRMDYINQEKLPKDYELGDFEISPSRVKITSSQSVIDQVAIVKVYVDVYGIKESINKREVRVNVYDRDGNELDVRVEPENVVASVKLHNPSKKVPVKTPTKGTSPEGFKLTSIKANVETVEVFAKTDVLDTINELSTEEIDLSTVKESGPIDTKLILPESAKTVEGNLQVIVEVEQTKTIKNVPIQVENLGSEQNIQFAQPNEPVMDVVVKGNARDISVLTTEGIRAVVDVKGLEAGTHEVPIIIQEPDKVKVTSKLETVKVVISEK